MRRSCSFPMTSHPRRDPVPDTFRDWSHADVVDGSRDDVTHGAPEGANVLRLLEFLGHIQLSEDDLDVLLAKARKQADEMIEIQRRGVTAIPDAMVAALRTYLTCLHEDPGAPAGSPEQLGHQLALQVKASGGAGFEVLVFAAFIVAARRHFQPTWSPLSGTSRGCVVNPLRWPLDLSPPPRRTSSALPSATASRPTRT